MATSNFEITPFSGLMENTEFKIHNLYLHQILGGANPNQAKIYDGVGPESKVVASAQSMHMCAGNGYNAFIISFEIERFQASTLHVMGRTSGAKVDDWVIIGGTDQFEMARGVIKRKDPEFIYGGVKQELTIHGFCRIPTPALALTPKKFGPWGGHFNGTPKDITETPRRLESITVYYGRNMHSIQFTFIDVSGKRCNSGLWGCTEENKATINLSSSEFVKEVSGTYVGELVSSLKFVTNHATYGPYGTVSGTAFKAPVSDGRVVVGFFAVTGSYLDQIGVYTLEN